jgi:AcrR family transcriptional regulator
MPLVADATVKAGVKSDGRVERGARTRNAIVEALLSLLDDGDPHPTARAVASRAGVSLRSVFQHFDDMESLYAMCVERQLERITPLMQPIDASQALDARIDQFVDQCARLYEQIAPVRRATVRAAPSSPVLQEALASMARFARRELSTLFAPELDVADRRDRLAALEVTASFDAWEHLRRVQGCSVPAARRALRRIVAGVLA